VKSALLEMRERYRVLLLAYVFMPDHAHFVLVPAASFDISRTMRVIKGGIARAINRSRGGTGTIWQDGFYDRVATGLQDLNAYITYVHDNPVRSQLVGAAEQYRWSSASSFVELDYHR
jgi:REP element-mobilizing transposase RayT